MKGAYLRHWGYVFAVGLGLMVSPLARAQLSGGGGSQPTGFGLCGATSTARTVLDSTPIRNDRRLARWMNPQRPGHGWDLFSATDYGAINPGDTALVWYTYDTSGRPTWFEAEGPLTQGLDWSNKPLWRVTKVGLAGKTFQQIGTVSLDFSVNGDPNLALVTWTISDATTAGNLAVPINTAKQECIVQLSKAVGGSPPPAGPTEAYSGSWILNDTGLPGGQSYDGHGLFTYFSRSFRDRNRDGHLDQDIEFDQVVLALYNNLGEPRWWVGQLETAGLRPATGVRTYAMRYVNNGYAAGATAPSSWSPQGPSVNVTVDLPSTSLVQGSMTFDAATPYALGSESFTFVTNGSRGISRITSARYDLGGVAQPALPAAKPAVIQSELEASARVGATTGEFRVDESGSATYSIPILAAPGSGGVSPKMTLSYSSGAGDGYVGVGWGLGGVSSISRCRKTVEHGDGPGPHPPILFTSADAFCLDGQRLIEIGTGTDATGAYIEYRTEIETFQRVRSYGDAGMTAAKGPARWGVWAKDGSYREFGFTANSRLLVNNNGVTVTDAAMSWAQNKFRDNVGNQIEYTYTDNDAIGEQYLTQIDYTKNPSVAGSNYFAAIKFIYGANRPEPQIQYTSGAKVTSQKLLTRIESVGTTATEYLRVYHLKYQDSVSSNRKQLRRIDECADLRDAETDATAICYAPTTFTWSAATGNLQTTDTTDFQFTGYADNLMRGTKFADINGDGRSELVWVENVDMGSCNGKKRLKFARQSLQPGTLNPFGFTAGVTILDAGAGTIGLPDKIGNNRNSGNNTRTWFFYDFNGDGADDLLALTGPSSAPHCPDTEQAMSQYTWKVYISDGNTISTAPASTIDTGITGYQADEAMLTDVNGDGVPDFVHSDATSANQLWLRNIRQQRLEGSLPAVNCNFRAHCFDPASRALSFTAPGGGPLVIPGIESCTASAKFWQSLNNAERLQPIDLNGDGRTDLRVRVEADCPAQARTPTPSDPDDIVRADPIPDPSAPASTVEVWVAFLNEGTVNGGAAERFTYFTSWDIDADTSTDGDVGPGNLGFSVGDDDEAFYFSDFNGDGLADAFFRRNNNESGASTSNNPEQWYYQINRGNGFSPRVLLPNAPPRVQDEKVNVVDTTGDGRADLVLSLSNDNLNESLRAQYCPSIALSERPFLSYPWTGNGFGTPRCIGPSFSGEYFTSIHDLDGDGLLDNVRFRIQQGRLRIRVGDTTSRFKARDVVLAFADGLGARTDVTYAPMTFSSVYERENYSAYGADSYGRSAYGRGSPVIDVEVPAYLVSYASASAPTASNALNKADIRYRYVGAKVQSGGRGSLGFARIGTLDLQPETQNISGQTRTVTTGTVTEYAQQFPLTGSPLRTTSWLVKFEPGSPDTDDKCLAYGPDSSQCMNARFGPVYGALGDGLCNQQTAPPHPFAWDATPLSCRSESYGWRSPTGGFNALPVNPSYLLVRPYYSASEERSIDGQILSSVWQLLGSGSPALGGYDTFGNILTSTSTSLRHDGGASQGVEVRRIVTANQYDTSATRISSWQLGRLTSTTVTTTRNGVSKSRHSAFEYDATTGLLTVERVMPNHADATLKLNTFHYYDAFGNKRMSVTCSGIADSTCTAQSGGVPTGVTGIPGNQNQVRRYSRNTFDPQGRFVNSVISPYTPNAFGNAVESATSTVTQRNKFGDPTLVQDVLGVTMDTTYGPLGRKYMDYANTGAFSKMLYNWCLPVANGVACPSGASYRVKSVAGGAPTGWGYFDILGRQMLTVKEGLNAGEFSASETKYDFHGRVSQVSEPFFTTDPEAGGFAGNPAAGATRYYTKTFYDKLGRMREVQTPYANAQGFVSTATTYTGLVTRTTNPKGQIREEQKNVLGEVVRVTDNQNLSTCYTYDVHGNLTQAARSTDLCASTLPALQTMVYDDLGRKIEMRDADMGGIATANPWRYTYNAVGELIKQTSPRGTCSVMSYDVRGRMRARSDYSDLACTANRDSNASWTYDSAKRGLLDYDRELGDQAFNTLSQHTLEYDGFGRVSAKVTTVGTVSGGYTYKQYKERTTYDQFGRVFQTFDASTDFNYNPAALPPAAQPLPSGLLREYNSRGHLFRLREVWPGTAGEIYWQAAKVDARGNVTEEWRAVREWNTPTDPLRPDHAVYRTYEPQTGRLTNIDNRWPAIHAQMVTSTSPAFRSLSYGYDQLGNVTSRGESLPQVNSALDGSLIRAGYTMSETFDYDGMNRLTLVNRTAGASSAVDNYAYDTLGVGNLTSKPGAGTLVYAANLSTYCGTVPGAVAAGPHAATQVGATSYCYDANGNEVRAQNQRTIKYTHGDQVKEVWKDGIGYAVSRFFYDANRQRYRRVDNSVGGSSDVRDTHYVGDVEVILRNGDINEYKRYVAGVMVMSWKPADGGGSRDYLLKDHQGSTDSIIDSFGNLELTVNNLLDPGQPSQAIGQRQSFEAFGWRRNWQTGALLTEGQVQAYNNLPKTTRGYTGHEQVDTVGLVHMNGRVYDPWKGRFVQADPFIQDPYDTQSLNRYAYVFNNPLTNTDPTGYFSLRKNWRTVVAIGISIATGYIAALPQLSAAQAWGVVISGGAISGAVQSGNLKGAVEGAFSAAIFHGIGGSGLSTTEKVVAHAIVGGVLEEVRGGNFGHGFVRAGLSKAITPHIDFGNVAIDGVANAILGGTISELTGGKFSNGASTAAMQFAFNWLFEVSIRNMNNVQEELNAKYMARMLATHPERVACIVPMQCAIGPDPDPPIEPVYLEPFTPIVQGVLRVARIAYNEFRLLLFSRSGYVYRGVHAGHPKFGDALKGIATPGNPSGFVSAEFHNARGHIPSVQAESPYTSWTTSFDLAVKRAGPGGIVLRAPNGAPPAGATWSWQYSYDDVYFESEVLLRGVRDGLGVLKLVE
jgi:RHS repeat-associated protein